MADDASHRAAGWALYEVKRYADALSAAQKALAAEPRDVEAHRLRALALLSLGRHGNAQRAIRDALALDPQSEWSHRIHAIVFLEAGQLKAARGAIAEAIRVHPRSVEAWSLVAEIELRRGDAEKAREAAVSALRINPNHGASLVRAAHAAVRTKRLKTAEGFARRAIALDPQSASAHRALGVVAFEVGDRAAARSAFREALRLDPTDEWARSDLLKTLRARSPLYRAMLAASNFLSGVGGDSLRWVGFVVWIASRALVEAGVGKGSESVAVAIVGVILCVPLVIQPLHDLIVLRDPFGRLLLRESEKLAALAAGLLLVVALALLGVLVGCGSAQFGWAAAGAYALAAYCALVRRVRTRAGAWRVGGAGVVLVAELVAALFARARGDVELWRDFGLSFLATLLVACVARGLLLDDQTPKVRRTGSWLKRFITRLRASPPPRSRFR